MPIESKPTTFWNLLLKYEIVIPRVQRDYAQGRTSSGVAKIRSNILKSLFEVLEKDTLAQLNLNFIYGSTSKGQMCPLDGQQRLTTLFLLHWYASQNEDQNSEVTATLSKFKYETRHNSAVFCRELVKTRISKLPVSATKHSLSEIIKDFSWYLPGVYNNDPTVSGMLVMLDAIQVRFKTIPNLWHRLCAEERIVFFYMPLNEYKMSDELYTRMNARGKALTDFEIIKSQIMHVISETSHETRNKFSKKVDGIWTNYFWDIFQTVFDEEILKFFYYIAAIDFYKKNKSAKLYMETSDTDLQGERCGRLEKLQEQLKLNFQNDGFAYLTESLDALTSSPNGRAEELQKYFNKCFCTDFSAVSLNVVLTPVPIRLFFENKQGNNIFKSCCYNYSPTQRNNPFSYAEQILLYAFLTHIKEKSDKFIDRCRILRNFIRNSEWVREEAMYDWLHLADEIILRGRIPSEAEFPSLHRIVSPQMQKWELKKQELTSNEKLIVDFAENHILLCGSIGAFEDNDADTKELTGFNTKLLEYFCTIFDEKKYTRRILRQALLATNMDISQYYNDKRIRRLPHRVDDQLWREFFTPSIRRHEIGNIIEALKKLKTTSSIESLISQYLDQQEKDWKYYFIKYDKYAYKTDTKYGCYYWQDCNMKPYDILILNSSEAGEGNLRWNFFLYILWAIQIEKETEKEFDFSGNKNDPLQIFKVGLELRADNYGFHFIDVADSSLGRECLNLLKREDLITPDNHVIIRQQNGIDIEDRIITIRNILDKIRGFVGISLQANQ